MYIEHLSNYMHEILDREHAQAKATWVAPTLQNKKQHQENQKIQTIKFFTCDYSKQNFNDSIRSDTINFKMVYMYVL